MKWLHTILLVLIATNLAFASLSEEELMPDSQEVSVSAIEASNQEKVFPAFTPLSLANTKGQWINLNTYKDQVLVIEFWASWCRYCAQSIQPLNKLQKKYSKKGVKVIAISIDEKEDVLNFLTKHKDVNYEVLLGNKEIAKAYGVWGLPTILVVGKDMTIRQKFSGYTNYRTIEKSVKKAL